MPTSLNRSRRRVGRTGYGCTVQIRHLDSDIEVVNFSIYLYCSDIRRIAAISIRALSRRCRLIWWKVNLRATRTKLRARRARFDGSRRSECLAFKDRNLTFVRDIQGISAFALEPFANVPDPLVSNIIVFSECNRANLLAIVIPSAIALAEYGNSVALRNAIAANMIRARPQPKHQVDLLVDPEPLPRHHGLLSITGEPVWQRLEERYGQRVRLLHVNTAAPVTQRCFGIAMFTSLSRIVRGRMAGAAGSGLLLSIAGFADTVRQRIGKA